MRNSKKDISKNDSDSVSDDPSVENSQSKKLPHQKPINDNDRNSIFKTNLDEIYLEVEKDLENELGGEEMSTENDTHLRKEDFIQQKFASVNSIFNIEELDSDDEIYSFQCPENYEVKDLCNKNLDPTTLKKSIDSSCEIHLINFEKKCITLAVPKKTSGGSLIKLPLKGHIVVQRVVDLPSGKSKVEDCDRFKIKFPKDLKVRHPLLGVQWKTQVYLANKDIQNENSLKRKSKKMKRTLEIEEKKAKKMKLEINDSEIVKKKKKKCNS